MNIAVLVSVLLSATVVAMGASVPLTFVPAPVVSINAAKLGYFAQLPAALFPKGSAVSSFTFDPCNGWYWAVLEHTVSGIVGSVSLVKIVPPPPSANSLPQGAKAQYATASLSLDGSSAMQSIPIAPFKAGMSVPDRYNVAPLRLYIERIQSGPTCEYWLAKSTSNSTNQLFSCDAPGVGMVLSCHIRANLLESSSLHTFSEKSFVTVPTNPVGITSMSLTSKLVLVGTSQGAFPYTKATAVANVRPVALHITNDPTKLVENVVVPVVQCVEGWGKCFVVSHMDIPYPNTNNTDLIQVFDLVHFNFQHFYRVPGIVDDTPLSMPYDAEFDQLHFVNRQAVNVLTRDGQFTRLGGWDGGVPQSGCIGGASVSVKIGPAADPHHMMFYGMEGGGAMVRVLSAQGVPSIDDKATVALNASWQYFYGPRWMPASGNTFTDGSNTIVAMGAGSFVSNSKGFASGVFATANGGLSFVSGGEVSLASKATEAVEVMKRHWRLNVTATLHLTEFGNPIAGAAPEPGTANDGLWTSIYVSAETFHYASLKKEVAAAMAANAPQSTIDALVAEKETARSNAWRAFSGMRDLVTVTGTPGYPARSFRPSDSSVPIPDGWFSSPTLPGYIFESGTSSDEIVGHLHVAPAMMKLLAETDEERAMIKAHHFGILDYIIWGNLTLVDPITGQSTHWGHWDPASINFSPFFYDGRGVNSNAILCYLVAGYAISNGEKKAYSDVFHDLVDNHGYAENIVNLKITQPSDVNYSDDELTYLPYLGIVMSATMLNGSPNPLVTYMQTQFQLSILRTTQIVSKVKSPYWNFIYIMSLDAFPTSPRPISRDILVHDALSTLTTFPASMIEWPIDNSARLDSIPYDGPTRNGQMGVLTHTLFPYNELSFTRWNSNPFQKRAGSGFSCHEPTAYTTPYWIGRYMGLVSKDL